MTIVVALAWLGVAACTLGPTAQTTPTASARPSSPSATVPPQVLQLATWQKCGATQVPPAEVLKTPTQLPKVINRTNGAISDADAQKWVAALLREQQIEFWAVANDEPGLLQGGCLGNPSSNLMLFGREREEMSTARSSNRKIAIEVASRLSLAVVPIAADVNVKITGLDGSASQYGIVGEVQGPGGTYYVDTNGNRTPVSIIKPSDHFFQLIGGEYKDPGIGPIWFQDSSFSCATSWLRQTCGT